MPEIEGQEPIEEEINGQEPASEDDQESSGNNGLTPEAIEAELRRARKEAAKYRTELRALQEAEEERKRSEMSEVEKLKADLQAAREKAQEAITAAREQLVRNAVFALAVKPEYRVRPEALETLWKELDRSALEVGDDGKVDGLAEELKATLERLPFLQQTEPKKSGISPTNPEGGQAGPNEEQLRREMFGGAGAGAFWRGGGVVMPDNLE